jgi:hypothetical protein
MSLALGSMSRLCHVSVVFARQRPAQEHLTCVKSRSFVSQHALGGTDDIPPTNAKKVPKYSERKAK